MLNSSRWFVLALDRPFTCLPVTLLLIVVLSTSSLPQDLEDDELRPGLIASFKDDNGNQCQRIDRAISFVWHDAPPDKRLGRGPFVARWNGYLMSQAPGKYQLHVYLDGKVDIKLNGKSVLQGETVRADWLSSDALEVPFDWHPLEIEYQKSGPEARLSLFWSGPQFQLEPIGPQQLYHDPEKTPNVRFERGAALMRALRCNACHPVPGEDSATPAPDLSHLPGNLHHQWLVRWLVDDGHDATDDSGISRRMPRFSFSSKDAQAIAAFLLADGRPAPQRKAVKGDPQAGQELFLTLGCLACHQAGDLGESGLFGGGDLTAVATKRPADFFAAWLSDPAKINQQYRMPVFELSTKERNNLAKYLTTLGTSHAAVAGRQVPAAGASIVERGRELFVQHRCVACHATRSNLADSALPDAKPLGPSADWQHSCAGQFDPSKRRPGYRLTDSDQQAIRNYITTMNQVNSPARSVMDGELLLAHRGCLACHARDSSLGMADKLSKVVAAHPQLAPLLPAMAPPSLTSVGDKLEDDALAAMIRRRQDVHRPWLKVRMPKFPLSDEELAAVIKYFVDADRIPARSMPNAPSPDTAAMQLAGARLVTTDGFGCTSCHQVGKVKPPNAPLNAMGPDLSLLGRRIRRPWYDRWVRNPARIVPRMEMPSVQLPVSGVLDDKLEDQLAAVWHVMNQRGFQPPEPNPVRVVRHSGAADQQEPAAVLTDVIQFAGETFVKPLVIGLPNRHNILFDFETSQLAGWWIGDVARQRTQGKTWFWEAAGADLLHIDTGDADMLLHRDAATLEPTPVRQFVTEPDQWRHIDGGLALEHRLVLSSRSPSTESQCLARLIQSFTEIRSAQGRRRSGFRRHVRVAGVERNDRVRLRVLPPSKMAAAVLHDDGREVTLSGTSAVHIRVVRPLGAIIDREGFVTAAKDKYDSTDVEFEIEYLTGLPVDQYLVVPPPVPSPPAVTLKVVPGYEAISLPIAQHVMPTALAWRPDGTLIVASLKGRVWLAHDTDGDTLEDRIEPFSDELAAPYGLAGYERYIDVINKYALLRLYDEDEDGRVERTVTLASGWGHTTDYHDWAVGLPRDEQGNYFVALPCQQDERSKPAAHWRGTVVKLTGREPTSDNPQRFHIERISGGHRFPMGIARNRKGELFVTDNQGNFNPFNELNHVIRNARYGFINALERQPDFHPPLTPPAIDIPHPWTRSVNGICFLYTPPHVRKQLGRDLFGPFEGHLVGCEYDSRRLIRMSLQRVGATYQGAAYPLSYDLPVSGPPLLGPLACAIAPSGDIYIGSIRDSGWGGANNIGNLVRLRPDRKGVPPGIAEVRANEDGFTIDFTAPVERKRAADLANYSISSFTRVSTPEYGGEDRDRRTEKITRLQVSTDQKRINLRLNDLRPGYVYEFRLRKLVDATEFFPDEAYYTLRTIPQSVFSNSK